MKILLFCLYNRNIFALVCMIADLNYYFCARVGCFGIGRNMQDGRYKATDALLLNLFHRPTYYSDTL